MAARSKARRRAVETLYESDLRAQSVDEALESLAARMQAPVNPYTETIARGVLARLEPIAEARRG